MPYTTMIFDIDGTLTDSASAILYALKRLLHGNALENSFV